MIAEYSIDAGAHVTGLLVASDACAFSCIVVLEEGADGVLSGGDVFVVG